MSYRALYRVWRPQRFDELVGQNVIATTLENTIKMNHVSHAYLFTGPRGTGKTSTAKIFSKAVNCPHSKGGEPCNKCSICKAITNGTLNDVIEIDAASNNGVDEIRNVRDKAHYAPTQAKYKIYIIDEVHMLSEGAFNALLKTLEEPPKNVIFILATTDLEKVPATIVSRTQHFTFKRIHPKDIVNRMKYILKYEHITYDVRALNVIAQVANGGMRDALSILDEALSYGADHISYETAMEVTGRVASGLMINYIKHVVTHNTVDALSEVHKLLNIGKSADQFEAELISYCQTLMMYKQSPDLIQNNDLGIIDTSFKELAKQISNLKLCTMIKYINDMDKQMQFSSYPNVCLEALTVQLSTIKDTNTLTNLQQQVKEMKSEIANLKESNTEQSNAPVTQNNIQTQSQPQLQPQPEPKQPVNSAVTNTTPNSPNPNTINTDNPSPQAPQPQSQSQESHDLNQQTASDTNVEPSNDLNEILSQATRQDLDALKQIWIGVINVLPMDQRNEMRYTKPVASSPSGAVISFKYSVFCNVVKKNKQRLTNLQNALAKAVNHKMGLVLVSHDKWVKIRNSFYTQN